MPTDKALPPRQARFIAEYGVDLNATAAAMRAGYSVRTAHVIASQLMRHLRERPEVTAGFRQAAEELGVDMDSVLYGLMREGAGAGPDTRSAARVRAWDRVLAGLLEALDGLADAPVADEGQEEEPRRLWFVDRGPDGELVYTPGPVIGPDPAEEGKGIDTPGLARGFRTARQKRFLAEYCRDFNARKAALRAGYARASAHNAGARLARAAKGLPEVEAARKAQAEGIGNALRILLEGLLREARGEGGDTRSAVRVRAWERLRRLVTVLGTGGGEGSPGLATAQETRIRQ